MALGHIPKGRPGEEGIQVCNTRPIIGTMWTSLKLSLGHSEGGIPEEACEKGKGGEMVMTKYYQCLIKTYTTKQNIS